MKRLTFLLFLASALVSNAQVAAATAPAATTTSLDRLIDTTLESSTWKTCRTQADRLALLREKALKNEAESDPVSDRYIITALGGPVDFAHFFSLAKIVCGGQDRRAALAREWNREGGEAYNPLSRENPPSDATPDDLPSNALGALFGEELKEHNANLNHDLIADLRAFFAKLEPVPDSIGKTFSHERIVLGLGANATLEERTARERWFTAEPAYILSAVAPERTVSIPNAKAALSLAGLVLRNHVGNPIVLDRVGTPDPEVVKFNSKLRPGQRISNAVPVPEGATKKPFTKKPVTKAVPVE